MVFYPVFSSKSTLKPECLPLTSATLDARSTSVSSFSTRAFPSGPHKDWHLANGYISVTEHLDVAPVGYFSSISSEFLKDAPPQLLPDELKRQAPELVFHWVTEDGKKPANLTGNTKVVATVSRQISSSFLPPYLMGRREETHCRQAEKLTAM